MAPAAAELGRSAASPKPERGGSDRPKGPQSKFPSGRPLPPRSLLFGDAGLSCDAAEHRVELRAGDAAEPVVGAARHRAGGGSTSPEGALLNSVFSHYWRGNTMGLCTWLGSAATIAPLQKCQTQYAAPIELV